jgi:hypothetical protein
LITCPTSKVVPTSGRSISATGGALPAVICTVAVPISPWSSFAWNTTSYAPAVVYVCVGFAAVDSAPSPKIQRNVIGSFSGSAVPALLKFTVRFRCPAVGFALASATGARSPWT